MYMGDAQKMSWLRGWRDGSAVSAYSTLAEASSSVLSTHVRQLETAPNFMPLASLGSCTHVHITTHRLPPPIIKKSLEAIISRNSKGMHGRD